MCMFCGSNFTVRGITTHTLNYKDHIIVIKNVPCLVQRILSNRHIDLSDFSYAALSSIAVATATPHSSALHMIKSSYANIADT